MLAGAVRPNRAVDTDVLAARCRVSMVRRSLLRYTAMVNAIKYFVAALLAVALLFSSYRLGIHVGVTHTKDTVAGLLASTQADLALNQIHRLRELQSDLERGCSAEALEKVGFDLQTQMYVLSSTVKEYSETWVVQNVSKRDPDLIHQLGDFKVQHNSWVEPKCKK